jgi:abnormal spindle-like microcephaly-associated protein
MHARKGSGDRSHTSLATKVVKALSSSDGALPEREQIKHRSHHPSIAQPKANEQPAASLGSGSTGKVCGDAFAVLTDDLEHPQLYEDKWLDHQEIALTQLLNAFFDAAAVTSQVDHTHKDLRSAMINLYNDQEIVNLVKRLQASLIYGSLSVPQEVMARNIRLTDDVGQRRRFLNIFLDAYNLPLLRAAAEAIIGRQCSRSSRTSSESASGPEREIVSKRELEEFLDAFVVRHEDVDASKAGPGTVTSLTKEVVEPVGTKTWAWRKTVVRSLMLVLLLDKAKSSKTTKWCLFQASSDLKSSEAVIKALGEILLPSYGDLMRPLRHLRYDISVNQHPLEEFNYKVENIATDLRDGIRLTKVVEILLDECRRVSGSDAVPSLTESLKLPCISRTQKLQNVMIALGAVVRLKSIPEAILKETTAFDIVDGHREKTLSLLWALLGQYSVDCLIDWNLLRAEYDWAQSQLSGGSLASNHIATTDLPVTTIEESWSLLTHWAKSLATLDGVQITNLTTSFADGRAFTAIIKAYLPYLPSTPTPHSSASSSPAAALRTLGCTPSFTALLSSPRASIPTRDFTLAALTFLAARLLPAARSHRAASTIQRAYRARLARLTAHRRAVAMRLAAHCAAVVNARDRVVWAARVMQRAWRAVLAAKIGALEGDVRGFQALARGWLVRSRSSRRPKYARAGW